MWQARAKQAWRSFPRNSAWCTAPSLAALLILLSVLMVLRDKSDLPPPRKCSQRTVAVDSLRKQPVREALTIEQAIQLGYNAVGDAVLFATGNAAMGLFAANWAESMRRLPLPLQFVYVPLDEAGYTAARDDYRIPVYKDPDAFELFSAGSANFRDQRYNQMAVYKWRVMQRLLEANVSVLMADPDQSMRRHPLAYLATHSPCDVSLQVDINYDYIPNKKEIKERGGYGTARMHNHYNTGFVLVRPSAAALRLVQEVQTYAHAQLAAGEQKDDQYMFNQLLQTRYGLKGVAPDADREVRGAAIVSRLISGQCLEYVPTGMELVPGAPPAFTVRPLNPFLFPTHPQANLARNPEHMLEPPFMVHYNWLTGTVTKRAAMIANCDWLLVNEAGQPA